MEMSLFKKQDIRKYMRMRMAFVAVVERETDGFVLIFRRLVGRLSDVRVLRGEGVGIPNLLLVEGRLTAAQRWKGSKRLEGGREVVKVSELKVES